MPNFHSNTALLAAFGYIFFTGVSVIAYVFEMVDVCFTLKNDFENIFNARLAKSLVLTIEEVIIFVIFVFVDLLYVIRISLKVCFKDFNSYNYKNNFMSLFFNKKKNSMLIDDSADRIPNNS